MKSRSGRVGIEIQEYYKILIFLLERITRIGFESFKNFQISQLHWFLI